MFPTCLLLRVVTVTKTNKCLALLLQGVGPSIKH